MLSDAAWTQVRGATALPSVAESHHPYVFAVAHPADEPRATHAPAVHVYHLASFAACTQVPGSTVLLSVAETQAPLGIGGGFVAEPFANAISAVMSPLNLFMSTLPVMPFTWPLSVCCQNVHFIHGAGRFGHSEVYCAIHSGFGANDVGPPTWSRQKYMPV